MEQVVVIGAGVGGLVAAAELARAGVDVTVLEAHVYPGGCASTFYHKGYRFDAGATVAGGFAPGAPMDVLGRHLGIDWEEKAVARAMQVCMPDGVTITRWADTVRWKEERQAQFGYASEPFWHWQERTAGAMWDLALRLPAWPPQTLQNIASLTGAGVRWFGDRVRRGEAHLLPEHIADAFRPVARHLHGLPKRLRQFVDAQLLIAAQTTSERANALYAAAALDLPRQGVGHMPRGIGSIAEKLVEAIRRFNGRVLYRQEVEHVLYGSKPIMVTTRRGETFPADTVIFNLPPWNITPLLDDVTPRALRQLPPWPHDGWGAFVVYVGLDATAVPDDVALHHQAIVGEPMGEGNTIFLSLSPAWDTSRAPTGYRALTISTHTDLAPWWELFNHDRAAYEQRKAEYTGRILAAAERILPGLREAASLVMSGTPVTFRHFTRRTWGWVGGFPQTSLLRAWGPRLRSELWMVGDSIFPGQSIPAVALGGWRVARAVLGASDIPATRAAMRTNDDKESYCYW
jgi:C-3',4' desaturase CrtD